MSALPAEAEAPAPSVSMLVRALAEAEDAFSAHRERLAQEHKAGLVLSGRVGELKRQLASIVGHGQAVTVKVSGNEAITVTIPAQGARADATCVRSRILR